MESIWWNQVTNAVRFTSQIKDCLLEEKSVLLRHSTDMPWRDDFVDTVKQGVRQLNADKRFEDIDSEEDPGKYILDRYCKQEKRAEYRPGKGYPKFFAESNNIVLHDRYLWVRIPTLTLLDKWMTFVSEYIKERGKEAKAVFVLEWNGKESVSNKRGIKTFSFDDFIGDYDRIVFAVLASSCISEIPFIKTYLAELVSNVVGNDIELSAECISNHNDFLLNPMVYIKKICDKGYRSDGTAFEFDKTEEEVNYFVWRAQIKTIYPHIEEFREKFVDRYFNVILKQLPIQASYGETYDDPKDVELGTLKYMADNTYISLNAAEYARLKQFKEARNELSHLTCLQIDEIKALI